MNHHGFQKMMRVFIVAAIVGCFGIAIDAQTAAGDTSQTDFMGVVVGQKYTNEYFGFDFLIPSEFTILDSAEATMYSNVGAAGIKSDSNKTKQIDLAMTKQATFILVFEKAVGTPGNAGLEIVVIKQAAGVTAKMALTASVALATSSPRFKLTKSLPATFGGQRFAGARIDGQVGDVKIRQELYVIIRRGYSVHMAITYQTEDSRKNMMKMMNSLKFTV